MTVYQSKRAGCINDKAFNKAPSVQACDALKWNLHAQVSKLLSTEKVSGVRGHETSRRVGLDTAMVVCSHP